MAKSSIHEVWKPIPGYPGYEASDQGRVRSIDRIVVVQRSSTDRGPRKNFSRPLKGRVLKEAKGGNIRYKNVPTGHGRNISIHIAVLLAFVGQCPDGMEVCHNNGNSFDNRLSNLRYDTKRSNALDCVAHGKSNARGRDGRFIRRHSNAHPEVVRLSRL